MSSSIKSKTFKENKEKICEEVFSYLESGEPEKNSGQLKFLKNLMIRSLALSTRKKINNPKKQLTDFLNSTILYNKDEVISYYDNDKNMEAFLSSPYYTLTVYQERLQDIKPELNNVPFFLMQKTQDVMEHALLDYIKEPFEDEEDAPRKLEAYVKLLYSIAVYEIFLRKFFKIIEENYIKEINELRAAEHAEKLSQQLKACQNAEELSTLLKQIITKESEVADFCISFSLILYIMLYYLHHLTNFFSVLRIIALIEFVNINGANSSRSRQKLDYLAEANKWREHIEEWRLDETLFAVCAQSKNMSRYYDEMSTLYCNKIMSDEEEHAVQIEYIRKYLDAIKKCPLGKRTRNENEKLWSIKWLLAHPLFRAANEISDLPKTASEKKHNAGKQPH